MKQVCVIVGTRPEVIKMAPVYFALQQSKCLEPLLLSTGQHREMLDQALDVFRLVPDHDLELMEPSQTLAGLTSRSLCAVTSYLEETRPAAVLVQGDTTTVLASALAAFYLQIPVGHVEAGLRTSDMMSPWPEEMNRRLTSPLCRWNFAPTETSLGNLLAEQISDETCYVTGNTVIDALVWVRDALGEQNNDVRVTAQRLGICEGFVDRFLDSHTSRFILVTGHRRESFGKGLHDICTALLSICDRHPNVGLLFPVHLNPTVRTSVYALLANHEQISLIEPVSYQDFVWLMSSCHFVISDSGGVQEEAPSLGKPVLVTRDTTERPEGIQAGTCRLVGTNPDTILREADSLLTDPGEYQRRSRLTNPYGDGNASKQICDVLEKTIAE